MISRTTHVTEVAGVRLREQHTSATFGYPGGGLGFAYRRPVAVEHEGETIPLTDIVFQVRVVALAVLALVFAFRRFTS